METFLEFFVYGFLNINSINTRTNGEILGLVFALICIILAFLLLNALIWSIIFKDENQIASEEF